VLRPTGGEKLRLEGEWLWRRGGSFGQLVLFEHLNGFFEAVLLQGLMRCEREVIQPNANKLGTSASRIAFASAPAAIATFFATEQNSAATV
jgi:hypothetical protein